MRTPAEEYFGPKAFAQLFEELTKFGQEKLGCTAISPPWLSFYVDGCEQRFHTDSWHGPWAFVLSLTGDFASAAVIIVGFGFGKIYQIGWSGIIIVRIHISLDCLQHV